MPRRHLLISCALLASACAPNNGDQFALVGLAGGLEGPSISYNGALRRITIVGHSDFINDVSVFMNPAAPVTGAARFVVVRMEFDGVNEPDPLEDSFVFTNAFEATPPPQVPGAPPEFPLGAPAGFDDELVVRIVYQGTGQVDRFENNTGIEAEVSGGGANDVLIGGSADDTIFGGNGNDRILGRGGDDRLYPGRGSDRVQGGDGDDIIDAYGASGNDGDTNRLCGGDGVDEIEGDPLDTNQLAGGVGNGDSDDGDVDELAGFENSIGDGERWEFITDQDVIINQGVVVPPDSLDFPTSAPVNCG